MTRREVTVGYVPLLDAAPLIIADALGFAGEEGLSLRLLQAPSWSALRDMLALEHVDAAQMLAPLPIAMAMGLTTGPARFEALSVLNTNGDVLGVSEPLAAALRDAGYAFDFRAAQDAAAALASVAGPAPLRIGVPFAFSMHAELVHYWLGGHGTRLPHGYEIRTVPPPMMAQALAEGEIDVFAVGEPWGSVAVARGVGTLLLPGSAIWNFAPEKVLATRKGWADAHPDIAGPLLRAVWRAGRWLGERSNWMTASEILAQPGRIEVAPEMIERVFEGDLQISPRGDERRAPHLIEFFSGAATFPWRSQAAWIGRQLSRRYGLPAGPSDLAARAVFRSDLYRMHLRAAGADLPGASEKLEGALSVPTAVASERGRLILMADRFFDARVFDPAAPER